MWCCLACQTSSYSASIRGRRQGRTWRGEWEPEPPPQLRLPRHLHHLYSRAIKPICLLKKKNCQFRKSSRNSWKKLTSIVFLGFTKRSLFHSKANLAIGSIIWSTALFDIYQIFCLIDKTFFLPQYLIFFVVFDNKRQSAFCLVTPLLF